MKKYLLTIIISCFLLSPSMVTFAKTPKNTLVWAVPGAIGTLDPAKAYDDASMSPIWNIYEYLIWLDRDSTENFVPALATEVPTVENGGISDGGKKITFKIRKGVKFHNGGVLTPSDIEYSLERAMITDPNGGPMWMLLEALTGTAHTREKNGKIIPGIFKKIDKSVEVEGNNIVIRLPKPWPPIMSYFVNTAASIVDKEWAIKQGCWDGKMKNAAKFNGPKKGSECLAKTANGTGPYKMKEWIQGERFVFERFEEYWGEKPPMKMGIRKHIKDWNVRRMALKAEDMDLLQFNAANLPDIQEMPNLRLVEYERMFVTAALFCQNIETAGNAFIGSGKLDGKGIPPNFFSDINVRKGFHHTFDPYIVRDEVMSGKGRVITSPLPAGLPFQKDVPGYEYNLDKAKKYMKKAWGGKIWKKGFKMSITVNNNAQREAVAHMIADGMLEINPKFKIDIQVLEWKDVWGRFRERIYPVYIMGWFADFPDPHNFLYTFMHSRGDYGEPMGHNLAAVDRLAEQGALVSQMSERRKIYHKLQELWVENALGITVIQPKGLRVYRKGVMNKPINALLGSVIILRDHSK